MSKRITSRKDEEPKHQSMPFPAFRYPDRSRVIMLENPQRYLVISVDNTVHIYSLPEFLLVHTLNIKGHKTSICSLDVHDDILVVASDDCVRIWDLANGECTQIIYGEGQGCLILSPYLDLHRTGESAQEVPTDPWILTWHKHSKLPSFSIRRLATIHKINNNGDLRSVNTHDHEIRSLASRGRTAVTGGFDCTVRVWDIFTGNCEWVFIGHSGTVRQVDLHQSSCYSLSTDGSLRIWDLGTGECQYILGSQTQRVREVGISASYLTYTYGDNTLYVRDLATQELKYQLDDALVSVDSGWQHDNRRIVTESDEGVTFWDIDTGRVLKSLYPPLQSMILLPFLGSRFCVAVVERGQKVWLEIWKFADEDDNASQEESQELVKPKRRRWIEVMF